MAREQVSPATVSKCRHMFGGAHDVGEDHGGQHPLRYCRWRYAADEQLDLVDQFWREEDLQVVVAADLRRLSAGDTTGNFDGGLPLEGSVEDQRRDAHGGQQVAEVGVVECSVERVGDRGTGTDSQVVGEESPLLLGRIERRAEVAQQFIREIVGSPSVAEVAQLRCRFVRSLSTRPRTAGWNSASARARSG